MRVFMTDLKKKKRSRNPLRTLKRMNRPEDKGVYQRIPVHNMGAYTEPAQPSLIKSKMKYLLIENESRKSKMTTVERIARFHLEFEGTHPFIDGNGRLFFNLELIREGFPTINVKFTDRKRYYDEFDAYYSDGDAGKMIDLIAEYVDKRLNDYISVLEN